MRRHRIEIIANILAICIYSKRKEGIRDASNLNHTQLEDYLKLLTSRGLLAHNMSEYVTTEKGHRFLEAYAQLKDVLEDHTLRMIVNTTLVAKEELAEPLYLNRV